MAKITRTCHQCGVSYATWPSQRLLYCSKSCARTALNLTSANPSHHRDISGDKNPMYGRGLKGAANPMYGLRKELCPRWKGGRKIRSDGYVLVVAPDDHPYPAYTAPTGTKYVLEHRLVVERRLGRYLIPGEVVHHIDGNPSNNDDANLRLFGSQSEHVAIGHAGGGAFRV